MLKISNFSESEFKSIEKFKETEIAFLSAIQIKVWDWILLATIIMLVLMQV